MSDHVKLSEVCEILNSNVDKKTKENEQKVKLCNFIDVYNNWAVTKYTSKKFIVHYLKSLNNFPKSKSSSSVWDRNSKRF
ncbi:hypothetical protein oki149_14930 [Helicobacter pylori]